MENEIEVLILCGGEGKRLQSVISNVPKPMAPISEKPFLEILVENIHRQGFKNICFLAGYKSESIVQHFNKKYLELNKRFSNEPAPLGTGGAIFKAMNTSSFEKFLIFNGDTFFNIDLRSFIIKPEEGFLKIAASLQKNIDRYGSMEVADSGLVTAFVEKKGITQQGIINGGIYFVDKATLSPYFQEDVFISLETDVFPELLKAGKVVAQIYNNEFIDIGIPEDYALAQSLVVDWNKGES